MPNQRVITAYETAIAGIPHCFDNLTGDSIRSLSNETAKNSPWTYPLKEAQAFITAHLAMLVTWRNHLDQLDSELRANAPADGIPAWAQQYLKTEARNLFAAQQTLYRAIAEYHHGTAGPLLDEAYGWAYELSNSTISPF